MGLLDIWKKEEEPNKDGMVMSSEYGYRSKKWIKRMEKKKKYKELNKKRNGYNKNLNDKIMEDYEKDLYTGKPRYKVGDMRYGYGRNYNSGYLLDDYYGSYDYGFNKEIRSSGSIMKDYEKTGEWKGYNYYKKATIDYKYIEQMANAFSAQHNIKVSIGKNWCIDLEKKELIYDPISLMYGTKADVIVCLLHEIGHLRYTTPQNKLKGGYYEKYTQGAHHVLNLFEDFRIDKKMITAYEGASDVYEATKKMVEKTAEKYEKRAKEIRNRAVAKTKNIPSLAELSEKELKNYCETHKLDHEKVKKLIGNGQADIVDNLLKLSIKKMEEGNIYDYVQGIIMKRYGHPTEKIPLSIQEYVEKTEKIIDKTNEANSTKEVLDILEKEVYPIIEELLKNHEEGSEEDQALFGAIDARFIQQGNFPDTPGAHEIRMEFGNSEIPEDWERGDYTALKESVDSATKELTKKLKNIKAKDLVQKWKTEEKRGKLNIKSVYRYPSGRFDIFKKKEKTIDRTQDFAFSILIDTSGSMSGPKIINATRGLIILNEVFRNLDMPFEVINFDVNARTIKTFEEKYDNKKKEKVGGLVRSEGGATRLHRGLNISMITKRPERNKYTIVLTDGAVESPGDCKKTIEEWKEKHKITSIGLNLECRCSNLSYVIGEENTKNIEEANELPVIFEGIIKDIIKKLK